MTWSTGLFETSKRIKSPRAIVHLVFVIRLYKIGDCTLLPLIYLLPSSSWSAAASAIVSRSNLVFKVIAVSCNYYLNVCKWNWFGFYFLLSSSLALASGRGNKADVSQSRRTKSSSFCVHRTVDAIFNSKTNFQNEARVDRLHTHERLFQLSATAAQQSKTQIQLLFSMVTSIAPKAKWTQFDYLSNRKLKTRHAILARIEFLRHNIQNGRTNSHFAT